MSDERLLPDPSVKIKPVTFSLPSGLLSDQIYNGFVQAEDRAMLGSNPSAAWSSEAARRDPHNDPACFLSVQLWTSKR
jgi:hypothetical protein